MTRSSTSGKGKPRVGPRIVRAWFDTVMNPLLKALEQEGERLAQNDWTWRFQVNALESIRPIRAYIDTAARDNLEQIFELYPEIKKAVKLHDEAVDQLLKSCRELHKVIESSADLLEVYKKVTSPASLARLDITLGDIFGAYPQSHHLAVLAQHIVNNTGALSAYLNIAHLWNPNKDEFLSILKRSNVRGKQFSLDSPDVWGKSLLARTGKLIELLKKKRLELSLEHDVPYVWGVTRSEEENLRW